MLFDVRIHHAMHAITSVVQNGNVLNVKKSLFESLRRMAMTRKTIMKMRFELSIQTSKMILFVISSLNSSIYCPNTENRHQCRFFLAKSSLLKVIDDFIEKSSTLHWVK